MHSDRSNGYIDERQRREVKLMTGRQLDLCICEIAAGDRDALSRLYLDMKDPIFRFALSLVRSRQLAEDIEAETFLNIMQSACGYKPGTNARAWIFAIARNCCMDCMKENARLLTVDSESLDLLPGADRERDACAGSLENAERNREADSIAVSVFRPEADGDRQGFEPPLFVCPFKIRLRSH